MKPLAASLLEALDYDSSDDSDFKVGDASGKHFPSSPQFKMIFCSHYFYERLWFLVSQLISGMGEGVALINQ